MVVAAAAVAAAAVIAAAAAAAAGADRGHRLERNLIVEVLRGRCVRRWTPPGETAPFALRGVILKKILTLDKPHGRDTGGALATAQATW